MDPLELDPQAFAATIEKYNPQIRDFYCEGKKDFSNYDSVSQGEQGDCWLLAPIAALSRSSQLRRLLQDNFTINTENKTYDITLFERTESKVFTVDGSLLYLPATAGFKSDLLFAGQQQFIPEKAKPVLKSLWFSFIEKAVALKLGGYHMLDGGDPKSPDAKQASLGFSILTGRPVTTIMIDETTDFASVIRPLLASGAAIVYTTKSNAEIRAASTATGAATATAAAAGAAASTSGGASAPEPALASPNASAPEPVLASPNVSANTHTKEEDKAITIKNSPEDDGDKSGLNLLEDHAYVIDTISRSGVVQLYNPHGEFTKIKAQNKAMPLTQENAVFFGKRLDIIPFSGGGFRRTKRRAVLRKTRR
jgi:hypothetical protein